MFGFDDRRFRHRMHLHRNLTVAEIALEIGPIAAECGVAEAYTTYSGPKHPASDRPECMVLVFRTHFGDAGAARRFSKQVERRFRGQIALAWAPPLDSDMEHAGSYGVHVPLRSPESEMFIRVSPMGSLCRIR